MGQDFKGTISKIKRMEKGNFSGQMATHTQVSSDTINVREKVFKNSKMVDSTKDNG